MLAAKRPVSLPVSREGVQNKRSKAGNDSVTSTWISPFIESGSASDSPTRKLLPPEQHHRVRIHTQLSEHSFFRGLPSLSADAVRYIEVITVNSSLPPHPDLSTKVPFHLKQVFSECNRAAKMAWIAESGLAEFPEGDLSDEQLGKLYKTACRKLARHKSTSQARRPPNSMIAHLTKRTLTSKLHVPRLDR